jgi:uncharacterized membrane-anchored protein
MLQLFRVMMVLLAAAHLSTTPAITPSWAQDSEDADPIARAHATGNLGPAQIKLGDTAVLELPKGYIYMPSFRYQAIGNKLEIMGSHKVLGAIMAAEGMGNWYITVTLMDTGHVTSAQVDALDKSEVLATLRDLALKNNARRMMAGFTKIDMGNWIEAPRHDAVRKRYTTSARIFETGPTTHDDNFANIDTLLFGRSQVLRMGLRAMLSEHMTYKPRLELLANAVRFEPGHRAEDYVAGTDKAAEHVMDVVFGGRTLAEINTELAEEADAAKRRAAAPRPMDRETQMKLLLAGLLGVVALIALVVALRGNRGESGAASAERAYRSAQRR